MLGGVAHRRLVVVDGRRRSRHVVSPDRQLVGVELVEVVGQPRRVGDVLLGGLPQLAGLEVNDPQAFAERGEADTAGVEHDVVAGIPACSEDPLRGGLDRLLHEVCGDPDDPRLAIDHRSTGLEDVQRFRVVAEHPGLLQDLERGQMDVPELVVREDVEAQSSAAQTPCMGASIHRITSSGFVRSTYSEPHGPASMVAWYAAADGGLGRDGGRPREADRAQDHATPAERSRDEGPPHRGDDRLHGQLRPGRSDAPAGHGHGGRVSRPRASPLRHQAQAAPRGLPAACGRTAGGVRRRSGGRGRRRGDAARRHRQVVS